MECVRLHVIAQDDGAAAQTLKLRVRDDILPEVQALFEGCEDADDAWQAALQNEAVIEKWAAEAARENGFKGPVKAETGLFSFDEREYAGEVYPAGEYRAIRIVIGEGRGRNWWCVLYPNVCLPGDYEPGMKVEFYSSIVRWIQSWFGGNENG